MRIFRLYDAKADVWMKTWPEATDESAVRALEGLLSQQNAVADHPEDYGLFRVGYDDTDNSGKIVGEPQPVHITNLDVIRRAMFQREKMQMELLSEGDTPVADLTKVHDSFQQAFANATTEEN